VDKFAKFGKICINAPNGCSRPLSQPPISHGKIYFFTAGFMKIGHCHGHLATLFLAMLNLAETLKIENF